MKPLKGLATGIYDKGGVPHIRVIHPETGEIIEVARAFQYKRIKCKHVYYKHASESASRYGQGCILCGNLTK